VFGNFSRSPQDYIATLRELHPVVQAKFGQVGRPPKLNNATEDNRVAVSSR